MATPHAMGGDTQKPHSKAWLVSGMTSHCRLPLRTGRPRTDSGAHRWGCPPVGFGGSHQSPVSPRSPSVGGLDGTSRGRRWRPWQVCLLPGRGLCLCSSVWEGPCCPHVRYKETPAKAPPRARSGHASLQSCREGSGAGGRGEGLSRALTALGKQAFPGQREDTGFVPAACLQTEGPTSTCSAFYTSDHGWSRENCVCVVRVLKGKEHDATNSSNMQLL